MPATRRKGPVRVKERDRGVTLWGRARPMMEGERAPLRDHAKRVGNRRKPASVCRDGHLTRKSKSKSKHACTSGLTSLTAAPDVLV